jgi:small-conductance mechanosensitive channel
VTDHLTRLGIVLAAVLGCLLVVEVGHRILVRISRRARVIQELTIRAHRPAQLVAVVYAFEVGLRISGWYGSWRGPMIHTLDLVAIGAGAWLLTGLLFVVEDLALTRFRTDVRDNRQARTVHTQVRLVRRATAVVVAMLAVAAMFTTFREVRLIGASVLASAGVAAAVATFAAQALLGNVLAGLQIAFGKSLRLDDVVVIEGEWGRVEAITLTYVVLHIWDDRRLIMPTSYFTTHRFENWTRSESSLLGAVEFELDWTVPVEQMRDELRTALTDTTMWDGRVSVLQVTDAVRGLVRLRAVVSAGDAPTLWDLRCHVRERLICWVRDRHPAALPRLRAEVGAEVRPTGGTERTILPAGDRDARVFGGNAAGRERAREFTGPPPDTDRDPEVSQLPQAGPPD